MLAWGDIGLHRLPYECVVYSQPVVSLGDIVFRIALDGEA